MRQSLIISVIVHVLVLAALFFVVKTVPEMRLPQNIYSVKIFQPAAVKTEPEKSSKPQEKAAEPAVPKPKNEKKKEPEKKPEVVKEKKADAAKEEKGMDVSVAGDPSGLTSMAIDAPRFPFSYYLSAVERKVSQNWFSSESGRGEGYSCVVYFRLARDGSVGDVSVEKSSGNQYFDRSAQRAVKSSAPFPPLPRAFEDPWLGIHFTFIQKD
jgi:TonB family protein